MENICKYSSKSIFFNNKLIKRWAENQLTFKNCEISFAKT